MGERFGVRWCSGSRGRSIEGMFFYKAVSTSLSKPHYVFRNPAIFAVGDNQYRLAAPLKRSQLAEAVAVPCRTKLVPPGTNGWILRHSCECLPPRHLLRSEYSATR